MHSVKYIKYLKESSSLSSFAASNKTEVNAANASFKSAPSTEVPDTTVTAEIITTTSGVIS